MEKKRHGKYARIGPSGWKCACCTPASPGKMGVYLRKWKKQERRDAFREISIELSQPN